MDPLERENSSDYVNQSTSQPEAPRPVQQVESPKPKKSRAPIVLTVLLVLALVAAGILAWQWQQEKMRVADVQDDVSKQSKQIAELKSALGEAEDASELDKDGSTVDVTTSDSEAIVEAALAYETALVNPLSGLKAEVAYNEGDYAKVNITSATTGHYQILKKSNDIWVVIATGNGPLDQEIIDRYGIPAAALK